MPKIHLNDFPLPAPPPPEAAKLKSPNKEYSEGSNPPPPPPPHKKKKKKKREREKNPVPHYFSTITWHKHWSNRHNPTLATEWIMREPWQTPHYFFTISITQHWQQIGLWQYEIAIMHASPLPSPPPPPPPLQLSMNKTLRHKMPCSNPVVPNIYNNYCFLTSCCSFVH